MTDPANDTASLSESQKLRKRLPEIPPEELAKHGDIKISHELPAEVQAQLKRRQFRNSSHKRSRSLSGIEGLYEQPDIQQTDKDSVESKKENLMPVTINNNAVSMPTTPVITRRSSDGGRSTEAKDQEILKELRWHYKQYIKASKRKKEKSIEAGTDTDRVLSAVQVLLNEDKNNQISTDRCNRCSRQVEILERVAVENHVFHKTCFVCAICGSWLNHFNYCFVPDHDKFYCVQHYQDIESASVGLDEQIRHALGIGPGVQQQFHYVPDSVDNKPKDNKSVSKAQSSIDIMKEKITLLSKRGKKLEKKSNKLRKQIDTFKGNDLEKGQLWQEWFESERDKNSTFRREAELTFRVRELELSEKYLELEKKLRAITEKTDNIKTEYDKSNEKELLQEMLVVVEKREHLIAEMEAAKLKYAEEDKVLQKQKDEIGINQPDLVKQASAADSEAKKVSEAVKQAPATIKKHSPLGCCVLL
ncbi:F-actin-monooxygenase MICAL1 [Exaiptasia diaphana]|uniref:LIM zinc-binding domain-containing protein n=1 Tax=Exaiptasia diaphana TaxID=2652724 RepID=A0A913X927_EXADI|nr:F-actin-monooxygenase MICAL1 [Exaiptasia diaphana]KXJ28604.1 Protein-methionine sulfoxide oxidase MICAL3 [Exaiptasia diaphana]